MNKDRIELNQQDELRIRVCTQVLNEEVSYGEAAELLQVSIRHVRRVVKAFVEDGARGIVHGNRGRRPTHTLDEETRMQIRSRLETDYAEMNTCHARDVLAERDGIAVSVSTVRRIREGAGLVKPRTRRLPAHRSRRERRPRAGMLVQVDGSHHRWFGKDHPACVLLAAIDDATGEVVAAVFREREDSAGYLGLLHQMVSRYGRPEAIYHDRHGIFVHASQEPQTIAEDVAGRRSLPEVGRAFAELEIRSISAYSPQAKGRIERLFGTLQDRLVREFALDGVTTLDDAQTALPAFVARYNASHRVPAADPAPAWRPLTDDHDLHQICAFAYARTVAADNTVSFDGRTIQIAEAPDRPSFAKCDVHLREHLDGSITVWWKHRQLATVPAPPTAPQLRARGGRRYDPFAQRHDPDASETIPTDLEPVTSVAITEQRPWKPASDHPWRKPFKPERTFSRNS